MKEKSAGPLRWKNKIVISYFLRQFFTCTWFFSGPFKSERIQISQRRGGGFRPDISMFVKGLDWTGPKDFKNSSQN
jgi:hypothetical protein